METQTNFFFSDSAYVSTLGRKLHKVFIDVYYSEAELANPVWGGCGCWQSERPLDKFTIVIFIHSHHCRSWSIPNNSGLIQVTVSNYSKAWSLSAPIHTSAAIATHTHTPGSLTVARKMSVRLKWSAWKEMALHQHGRMLFGLQREPENIDRCFLECRSSLFTARH